LFGKDAENHLAYHERSVARRRTYFVPYEELVMAHQSVIEHNKEIVVQQ
jgi:hypothetical protein